MSWAPAAVASTGTFMGETASNTRRNKPLSAWVVVVLTITVPGSTCGASLRLVELLAVVGPTKSWLSRSAMPPASLRWPMMMWSLGEAAAWTRCAERPR
ncbi:hypothetical protein [Cystobacter fuscus]|uniref:hypothetical protein n=1 Tax=Cystobacter fuscus TaxID=43 RepID=UPI0005BE75F6|nr:hypothetical protein [Cystobacter fuscus]